jgi:hypothetical protein
MSTHGISGDRIGWKIFMQEFRFPVRIADQARADFSRRVSSMGWRFWDVVRVRLAGGLICAQEMSEVYEIRSTQMEEYVSGKP